MRQHSALVPGKIESETLYNQYFDVYEKNKNTVEICGYHHIHKADLTKSAPSIYDFAYVDDSRHTG